MEKLCQEVSIPRPVAVSRHVLAMEFVSGPPLNRIVLSDPADGLDLILAEVAKACLLYTSPSPRDRTRSRMPSTA